MATNLAPPAPADLHAAIQNLGLPDTAFLTQPGSSVATALGALIAVAQAAIEQHCEHEYSEVVSGFHVAHSQLHNRPCDCGTHL